jgi:Mg2+/citrate symporter
MVWKKYRKKKGETSYICFLEFRMMLLPLTDRPCVFFFAYIFVSIICFNHLFEPLKQIIVLIPRENFCEIDVATLEGALLQSY